MFWWYISLWQLVSENSDYCLYRWEKCLILLTRQWENVSILFSEQFSLIFYQDKGTVTWNNLLLFTLCKEFLSYGRKNVPLAGWTSEIQLITRQNKNKKEQNLEDLCRASRFVCLHLFFLWFTIIYTWAR